MGSAQCASVGGCANLGPSRPIFERFMQSGLTFENLGIPFLGGRGFQGLGTPATAAKNFTGRSMDLFEVLRLLQAAL